MNTIDKLTHRLATQQPELKDADALLESIMNRLDAVEQLPPLEAEKQLQIKPQKEGLLLSLACWCSSIAAVMLLALFISQNSKVENPVIITDYSTLLSDYQPDYNALKHASNTTEALRIVAREKSEQMIISELKRQFIYAHQ